MSIVANTDPRIREVKVTTDTIVAYLVDGRVISVPLVWSWRLSEATPTQRTHFELIGDGQGVHWRMSMKTSAWKVCSTACPPIVRKASFISGAFKIKGIVNHLTKGWRERGKHVAHPSVCSIEENLTSASQGKGNSRGA